MTGDRRDCLCTNCKCNCYRRDSRNTGKHHPTANELLIHFYQAVNVDDELRAEWNCTDLPTLHAGKNNTVPPAYAAAMILERKYWAYNDELRLDKVIDAIEKAVSLDENEHQQLNRTKADFCNQWIKPKENKNTHERFEAHFGKDESLTQADRYPPDLAVDLLYGSLLHGDYSKWVASKNVPFTTMIAIGIAVPHLNQLIHDVYSILDMAIKNKTFKPDTTKIMQDTPAVSQVFLWR